MNDFISRQAAKNKKVYSKERHEYVVPVAELDWLPPAQPKQTDCEYCHEDSDGYVRPLERNCHAFVRYGINGWEISLKAKGWSGSAKIKYCPMCGRELKHG